MTNLIQNNLILKKSLIHGYGVFAGKNYKKGEIIEECYTLLTDGADETLKDYYFNIADKSAVMMGFGSLYNHSDNPNLTYHYDDARKVSVFSADKAIKKNEELYIYYGETWFSGRNMIVKKIPLWRATTTYFTGVMLRILTVLTTLYVIFIFLKLGNAA